MDKWTRINYQTCMPLGDNNSQLTGCNRHIQLSRQAAQEGIVLLKNKDNILPLKKGSKIAIFGKAQIDYVKGGGGSGDVFCEYVRNIYDGLKMKSDVEVFDKLSFFYKCYVEDAYKAGEQNGMFDEAEIPGELLNDAKSFTDTAIITINRYSAENSDRKNDGTDTYFGLSEKEKQMVKLVCESFENVIVLINAGAMIDTSWFANDDKIKAALMIWQGGMEGGLATADILVGEVNPSGKLADTCAGNLEDYPSSEGFYESDDYVKYTEDIFVGYRYFETIPGRKECVVYPFGYGLSYTEFEIKNCEANKVGEKIVVCVDVENVGKVSGKEVVQVYFSAPCGKITKPAMNLCAFAKTKLLEAGETQSLMMAFEINDMASFDDMGDVCKNAYVLEKGEYKIYVGTSVRDTTELTYKYIMEETKILSRHEEYCAPESLGKRLTATGEYREVPNEKIERKTFKNKYICEEKIPADAENIKKLISVANGETSLDEFISQLTNQQLMGLLFGKKNRGIANTGGIGGLKEYGIPSVMTADGPAGVRLAVGIGVKTTAFPVATMLACTWNTEIVEKIGVAGANEMKENNMFIWLTPALNIHRSPLCGRNFEYYSEDPFVAGKMASAMVRGIQSQGVAATPKHFACNNKETNRMDSDSVVSQRALREIYIKGFEICIKEARPKLIMTSYNKLNGTYTSENAELLEGILRGEWGYKGAVTTDWYNHANHKSEVMAGNDVKMPCLKEDNEYITTVEGIDRNKIASCVKRILEMILWFE
ncbi:MAG: glycoside hydrolase family 3 C-terminal domain-containing protein [Clostridia bacterium]|nr:glycoside hydrolase family 3 C-terminal domain-containing protein [Clostridia bacterium]